MKKVWQRIFTDFSSLAFVLFFSFSPVLASEINSENILRLTNAQRQKADLSPLAANANLQKAAEEKAEDMITRNYFEHFTNDGKSPWDFMVVNDYQYQVAAENLAMDFQSAEGAVFAWMNSGPHRKNILNSRYEDIGIGIVKGAFIDERGERETTMIVQMFGSQKSENSLIKLVNSWLGIEE